MRISDFEGYKVEDFVEDDHFRKWILEQDTAVDFFWQAYLRKYPHQEDKMNEARYLILDMFNFFNQKAETISIPDDGFSTKLKEIPRELSNVKVRRLPIYKLAAACILLTVISTFCYFQLTSKNQIEYITSNGEWEKITLPDGSKVQLNANSQLSLIKDWKEGEDRMVWLKGEAFFQVEKKPSTNAKFTVVTKDLKIKILGTTFNVNTRNQQTEVFLEEGKITLELDEKKESIEPGEFIAYSKEKKKITSRHKKTEKIHSDWKNGFLKINNASMKVILDEIEIIYGIDLIATHEKILEKEGTITIPVDNLAMTKAILERAMNVKIEKKGKQLFIY